MKEESVPENSLKSETSVSCKSDKKRVDINEVHPFYNRDVCFVTIKAAEDKMESRIRGRQTTLRRVGEVISAF